MGYRGARSRRVRAASRTLAVALVAAGCTGAPTHHRAVHRSPTPTPDGVATAAAGVPVPVRGFYWGGINNKDRDPVPGCPDPGSYAGAGGRYGGLECKLAWAARTTHLSLPGASGQPFHTTLARAYLNGPNGCVDDLSRVQRGGDIHRLAAAPGRQVLLLSTKCGAWRDLAEGGGSSAADDAVRRLVDAVDRLPVPTILVFHHEPENDACTGGFGTPDQYRAAYRRFVADVRDEETRLRSARIATGWVLMGATFDAAAADHGGFTGCGSWRASDSAPDNPLRNPENFYPGDDAVDWLGADVYTHGAQHPLRDAVRPFADWTAASCPSTHPAAAWSCSTARGGKPLMLAEFGPGIANRAPTQAEKAAWFDQLHADLHDPAVTDLRRIKAYSYWSSGQQNVVDMPPDPAHPALLAFARLTLDPLVARPVLPTG